MTGRGYGLGSVFDDGWASPYELESQRVLEQAKQTARARAEQQQSFMHQAIDAAAASRMPAIDAERAAWRANDAAVTAARAAVPDNCAAPCRAGGCQFDRAKQMLAQAQAALETSKRLMRADETGSRTMSRAMWCDVGMHAYSENDPKAEQWQKRLRDPETGEPKTVMLDVCGECVATGGSPDFNGPERAAIMRGEAPHPAPAYAVPPSS